MAVKATIQILYDERICNDYDKADEVQKDYLVNEDKEVYERLGGGLFLENEP